MSKVPELNETEEMIGDHAGDKTCKKVDWVVAVEIFEEFEIRIIGSEFAEKTDRRVTGTFTLHIDFV